MSGQLTGLLTGLQARVKENSSVIAFYVHCCSHDINLSLMDVACWLCSAKVFFGNTYTAFGHWASRGLTNYKNRRPCYWRELSSRWGAFQIQGGRLGSRPKKQWHRVHKALRCIKHLTSSTPRATSEAHGLLSKHIWVYVHVGVLKQFSEEHTFCQTTLKESVYLQVNTAMWHNYGSDQNNTQMRLYW